MSHEIETYNIAVLSTAHITEEDSKVLTELELIHSTARIRCVGSSAKAVKLADRIANSEAAAEDGSGYLEMYKKEFPFFRSGLHSGAQEEFPEMWQRLEELYA